MKSIFFVLIFAPLVCHAQIESLEKPKIQKPIIYVSPVYDTLSNIKTHQDKRDYIMYVGQEIYYLPYIYGEEYGYHLTKFDDIRNYTADSKNGFSSKNYEPVHISELSGSIILNHTFKIIQFVCIDKSVKEVSVEGEYFIIQDIKDDSKYVMRLTEWEFDKPEFPKMIILSYFSKQKDKYIGKKFVFNDEEINKYDEWYKRKLYNYSENGNLILPIRGEIWECVDLKLVEKKPRLILENKKGDKLAVDYSRTDFYIPSLLDFCSIENSDSFKSEFISYEEYLANVKEQLALNKIKLQQQIIKEKRMEELKKQQVESAKQQYANIKSKYGEDIAKLVQNGKVKIGMNKDLCRIAWGVPKKVNTTTNSSGNREQWVYSTSRYLYFLNGILTTIQF